MPLMHISRAIGECMDELRKARALNHLHPNDPDYDHEALLAIEAEHADAEHADAEYDDPWTDDGLDLRSTRPIDDPWANTLTCPRCGGAGWDAGNMCQPCHGGGWITRAEHERGVA